MAEDELQRPAVDSLRRVTLERVDTGVYDATNAAGRTLRFGSNDPDGFSPVELLLAAIGGCTAVDVDVVTGRRATPDRFVVDVETHKHRDEDGNCLRDISVTFRIAFPAGDDGDAARAILPRAVATSHDRTCTVGRTVALGTPVTVHIEEQP